MLAQVNTYRLPKTIENAGKGPDRFLSVRKKYLAELIDRLVFAYKPTQLLQQTGASFINMAHG